MKDELSLQDLVVVNSNAPSRQGQRERDELNGSFALFENSGYFPDSSGVADADSIEDFGGHDSNVFSQARSAKLKPHRSCVRHGDASMSSSLDADDDEQFFPFSNQKRTDKALLSSHLQPNDKDSLITSVTAQTEEMSIESSLEGSKEGAKSGITGAYLMNNREGRSNERNERKNRSRSKSQKRSSHPKRATDHGEESGDDLSEDLEDARQRQLAPRRRSIVRTKSAAQMEKGTTRIKVRRAKSGEGLMDSETAKKLIAQHLSRAKSSRDVNAAEKRQPPGRGPSGGLPRRGTSHSRSFSGKSSKLPQSAEDALRALMGTGGCNTDDMSNADETQGSKDIVVPAMPKRVSRRASLHRGGSRRVRSKSRPKKSPSFKMDGDSESISMSQNGTETEGDGAWTSFQGGSNFNQSFDSEQPPSKPARQQIQIDGEETYYSIKELQEMTVQGLDYGNREQYLSPGDFVQVFECTREEWAQYPRWKQQKKKRAADLF